MGHQVEYFAKVERPSVRSWLNRLKGFYCHEPDDRTEEWEGELASGGTFWAHMMPTACNFSLGLKYSGLYHRDAPAVDFATRFEAEFWNGVGRVPLVRVDEFLVGEWYQAVDRDWEDMADPAGELLSWLRARDGHWHLLFPDGRVEGPA